MFESIIANYLHQHRRLVIPNLGAFLKKEEGEIVFVPFLNKDDGVLNGLVSQAYGSSAAEAEGMIAQYVESVRTGIESRGSYLVSPLGSLKQDANRVLFLDRADLAPRPAHQNVARETASVPESVVSKATVFREPEAAREPVVVPVQEKTLELEMPPRIIPAKPEEPKIIADAVDAPKTINDLIRERHDQQAPRQTVHDLMAEPGEEPKPLNKISRPASPAPKRPETSPTQKEKRGDIILIAAVVITILAVVAMIYGYAVSDMPLFNLQ